MGRVVNHVTGFDKYVEATGNDSTFAVFGSAFC